MNQTPRFTSHSTHLALADLFFTLATEQCYFRGWWGWACGIWACGTWWLQGQSQWQPEMPNMSPESQAPKIRKRFNLPRFRGSLTIFLVYVPSCAQLRCNVTTRTSCRSHTGPGSHQSHRCLHRNCWVFMQWRDSALCVCKQMTFFTG